MWSVTGPLLQNWDFVASSDGKVASATFSHIWIDQTTEDDIQLSVVAIRSNPSNTDHCQLGLLPYRRRNEWQRPPSAGV
jgi:hypothetical protein